MSFGMRKDLRAAYGLTLLLLIQPFLENYILIFSFLDEFLVIGYTFFFVVWVFKSKKIYISELKIILLFLSLITIGLIGNLISQAHQKIVAIFIDIISNSKCFLFLLPLLHRKKWNEEQKELFSDLINITIRLLIVVMFICALISQIIDIGMSAEKRFGIVSFKFLFPNPAGLNTYCYSYVILFSATLLKHGKIRKHSTFFAILLLLCWISTLRSRALAFASIYALLYYAFIIKNISRKTFKFRWYHALIILVILFLIGWNQFYEYFINNSRQARYVLARTSIEIAKDYFPCGTGFATFGTAASRTYYSPVYSLYGISSIWGISKDSAYFILDQYWFGILGQFGILGTIILMKFIFDLYSCLWKRSQNKALQIASIVFIYTSFIASISAASFIQASILLDIYVLMKLAGDAN